MILNLSSNNAVLQKQLTTSTAILHSTWVGEVLYLHLLSGLASGHGTTNRDKFPGTLCINHRPANSKSLIDASRSTWKCRTEIRRSSITFEKKSPSFARRSIVEEHEKPVTSFNPTLSFDIWTKDHKVLETNNWNLTSF